MPTTISPPSSNLVLSHHASHLFHSPSSLPPYSPFRNKHTSHGLKQSKAHQEEAGLPLPSASQISELKAAK